MSVGSFRAKIQKIRPLSSDIRELTLEMVDPASLSFQAGQSISVIIPDATSSSPLQRYFSLASTPRSATHLVLLLNNQDRGKGSTFLLGKEIGEDVQITGPYGSFHLQHEQDKDLLFIGTGTGAAPLWSMITTLLEESCSQPMTLLWGLRSELDSHYLQELEDWTVQYENFSFVLTLSNPSAAWEGKKGRVTDVLQELSTVDHLAAYVCGNRAMVKEVHDLLKEKGNCAIYRERYSEAF